MPRVQNKYPGAYLKLMYRLYKHSLFNLCRPTYRVMIARIVSAKKYDCGVGTKNNISTTVFITNRQ